MQYGRFRFADVGDLPWNQEVALEDTDSTMHAAHDLKVSATDAGGFTVFNSRTNDTKRYAARR